jgi:CRP-like cAMP-binding protein
LFSELSEEEAKRLAAFATETSVPEGEFLVREGDFSTELLAIEEGTADVLKSGTKIASLKKGDLIGEIGLLENRARGADVVASSPMLLIKLTHWEIRRMSRDTLARIEALIEERQRGADAEA